MKKYLYLLLGFIAIIGCKNNATNPESQDAQLKVDWNIKKTDANQTIGILAKSDSTVVLINSKSISEGDLVGVFYKVGDSLKCAGKVIWAKKNQAIAVMGDDPSTAIKDGMAADEELTWLVKCSSDNKTYEATPLFYNSKSNKYSAGSTSLLEKLTSK